jgi:DNA-binding response OmpR family regulator
VGFGCRTGSDSRVDEAAVIGENESPVVLVIEDDQSISEIVTRVLRQEGCVTHAAYDGAQGLDTFYLTLPDLVILDVKMPVMDGWETLVRLRGVSRVPIIMLTIYSAKQDIIKGLDLGADDYLVKPFGIRELIARVHAVMRRVNPVRGSCS